MAINSCAARKRREPAPSRPATAAAALLTTALLAAACESPLEPGIELVLSQPEVELRAVRGSTEPLQGSLTVRNRGGGRLGPVSCPPAPAEWLTCEVSSGHVVLLTAHVSELTESPEPLEVPLTAAGAATPVTVSVTLLVESPTLALGSASVSFTADEDSGATTPGSALVPVLNVGAGELADLGAIACEPADERVTCDLAEETGTLTLAVDPEGLTPGIHLFPVEVRASNSDRGVELSVLLTVRARPHLALSTNAVHFGAIRGVESPLARTVTVSNSGVGSLGTLSCPADPAPWLACAVVGNLVTLTALPEVLTASPDPVTVPVTATEAVNSPQGVQVSLALEQPVLSLSTYWTEFQAVPGADVGSPSVLGVELLNTGAGSLENLGGITCSVGGGAPLACTVDPQLGELRLSVDPGNLAAGVTAHPVVVTAEHSEVTRTITVVVTTLPAPFPVLDPDELTFEFAVGGTEPALQTVVVTNGGGGDLGEVSCEEAPADWLTCAVEEVDGGWELHITASPAGLMESPAPIVVEVRAEGAPDTSVELVVTLNVE